MQRTVGVMLESLVLSNVLLVAGAGVDREGKITTAAGRASHVPEGVAGSKRHLWLEDDADDDLKGYFGER